MNRDEQIANWIESIGNCFVMYDNEAVLLPRKACDMIALMLRNGNCRSADAPRYESQFPIRGRKSQDLP